MESPSAPRGWLPEAARSKLQQRRKPLRLNPSEDAPVYALNAGSITPKRPGSFTPISDNAVERAACPGIGTCAWMFSANTMVSVAEALGLTVPRMAAPPAAAADRLQVVHAAADALLHAVRAGIRPSDVLTRRSLENAAAVASALGGPTNACLHLLGIAAEAGIEFTLADIDAVSRRTPQPADMKPAGQFMMRELLSAGLLYGETMSITERTIAEKVVAFPAGDAHPVLRSIVGR